MLNPKFRYSLEGDALTEKFEGLSLVAYQDIKGVWTIGYGHTGPEVIKGLVWTLAKCVDALNSDIQWASNAVNTLVSFQINQLEFDAIVDFVFNVGAKAFAKSTLLLDLNEGNIQAAALQFDLWDHAAGKVVSGLLKRRIAETTLFNQGDSDEQKPVA